MEYTYEFLKKCDGIRFRAKWNGRPIDGMIRVFDGTVWLYYGAVNWLAHPTIGGFGKYCVIPEEDYEEFFSGDFSDFEIVPRSPETYKDWHVGDKMKNSSDKVSEVIFRCGEAVFCKNLANGEAIGPFTCEELFRYNYRLILTDIEKKIIEERKKAEWEPQDGDVCYLMNNYSWIFVKKKDSSFDNAFYVSVCPKSDRIYYDGNIMNGKPVELRPATDEEKQRLFDALAKKGKRWNAEKKAVEDIPKETKTAKYDFTKFAPVLVRNSPLERWRVEVFYYMQNPSCFPFVMTDETEWSLCLPLNEKTMHLIGTNDNYEEEQS